MEPPAHSTQVAGGEAYSPIRAYAGKSRRSVAGQKPARKAFNAEVDHLRAGWRWPLGAFHHHPGVTEANAGRAWTSLRGEPCASPVSELAALHARRRMTPSMSGVDTVDMIASIDRPALVERRLHHLVQLAVGHDSARRSSTHCAQNERPQPLLGRRTRPVARCFCGCDCSTSPMRLRATASWISALEPKKR